jgi:hypothetical protein
VWWFAEVVAQSGGALGAPVEQDMRSGAERGAAKGMGWVRTLLDAVETGVAENEEVSNTVRN